MKLGGSSVNGEEIACKSESWLNFAASLLAGGASNLVMRSIATYLLQPSKSPVPKTMLCTPYTGMMVSLKTWPDQSQEWMLMMMDTSKYSTGAFPSFNWGSFWCFATKHLKVLILKLGKCHFAQCDASIPTSLTHCGHHCWCTSTTANMLKCFPNLQISSLKEPHQRCM